MVQLRQDGAVRRRVVGVRGLVVGAGGRERALDVAQFAVAVQHVFDRRRGGGGRLLRDVRNRPRRRQLDRSGVGQELVAYRGEKARLARAVGADQSHLVPGVQREVRAFEQAFGAACEGEVNGAQHQ